MELSRFIPADDPALQYMGRIDRDDPKNPVWVYPCTCVRFRFTGTWLKAELTNLHGCWSNYLGAWIDGEERCYRLENDRRQKLTLADGLAPGEHEVLLFKRQDSCHLICLHGLELAPDAAILPPEPLPTRRIEVYGDSVSAGEVSEALDYCGRPDPPHDGEYSNGYYSYAWYTARRLNAQLHDIAQGGIALLPGTGYFHGPDYQGIEAMYDKIQYFDQITPPKPWDFSRYTPHVVILAIGQNDNHPNDYMTDYDHPDAARWRSCYRAFVQRLRAIYPHAHIILSTTILNHHENWDKSIHQVWQELNDPRIHHFLYGKNGCGTHGHIRAPEAEQMAAELSAFIETLDRVWEDEA